VYFPILKIAIGVSPIDYLAKWAAMIFGYFDESGEKGDGFVVVAGLLD
jgi:hypothetical protein